MIDTTRKVQSVQDFKNDIRLVRLAQKKVAAPTQKQEEPRSRGGETPSYGHQALLQTA